MFLKTFNTKMGLIAVFKPSEEEIPRLYFYFEVNDMVVAVQIYWADTKHGWARRNEIFTQMSKDDAMRVISKKYDELTKAAKMCFVKH